MTDLFSQLNGTTYQDVASSFKGHVPVLLYPMYDALAPKKGGIYLDGTFGGGGYTRYILETCDCIVHALDRDPDAFERSRQLSLDFPNRFFFHQGRFSDIKNLFDNRFFDGVVFDFGVSSFQLDVAERGFSFKQDGPLDMRMNPLQGIDAATVVNTFSEEDLYQIIKTYGEEPKARQVAKAIVDARKTEKFQTTAQLATYVRKAALKKSDIDSATLTFQGLRIFVNNELIEIDAALKACRYILKDQGKLVTVTFHSLEDRLCKQFFKQSVEEQGFCASWKNLHKKPIEPSHQEQKMNPRSRSAKLRCAMLQLNKERPVDD